LINSVSVNVSDAAQLQAALSSAKSGETILLSSGNYGSLNIYQKNFTGSGITIAAASSTADAVITGLHISASSGIKLSGLDLNCTSNSNNSFAYDVLTSSNITLTGLTVHGAGTSSGLEIEKSSNVVVSNSTISNVWNGIVELNNSNISITGNTLTRIGGDGIDNGGSSNVTISNNSFTNFLGGSSTQHPDAIQFWTTNTTQSASNIVVSDNNISVGSGAQVQGIFMTDQVGNLPYENVTITGNTVTAEMYNGIVVNDGTNVTVTGNTVVGLSDSALTLNASSTYGTSPSSWIEMERVSGLNMSGNNASGYVLSGNTNATLGSNAINGVAQQTIVESSVSATLSNLQNELVLTGNKAINGTAGGTGQTIIANGAGDRLYDNYLGHDTLIGGSGNDVLISRGGVGTLTGGGGNNIFEVQPIGGLQGQTAGNVTITDFLNAGSHNTLDISSFLSHDMYPTLTSSGNNTILSFSGTAETITLLGVHPSDLIHSTLGYT
jgi:hypothetical protein